MNGRKASMNPWKIADQNHALEDTTNRVGAPAHCLKAIRSSEVLFQYTSLGALFRVFLLLFCRLLFSSLLLPSVFELSLATIEVSRGLVHVIVEVEQPAQFLQHLITGEHVKLLHSGPFRAVPSVATAQVGTGVQRQNTNTREVSLMTRKRGEGERAFDGGAKAKVLF